MKEILSWLIMMEGRAETAYSKASAMLAGSDSELSGFFKELSEEESVHRELMEKAARSVKGGELAAPVRLDEVSMETISSYFSKCETMIEKGPFDSNVFLECIVSAEFSEWNDLFRFIINRFRADAREFAEAAVQIQHHRRHIEEFVEGRGELKDLLDRIRGLPRVWEDSILVVEDDDDIRDLLKDLLYKEGFVDAVRNGREGLEKIEERYYSVILSDWDMPVMNGLELYKAASARYPGIGERFIFFSGSIDKAMAEFLESNRLKCLPKPSSIREIRKAIAGVLSA